ncbi:DNA-binding protein [Comamonas phosphati]|nr:DNA-binding protein [Comamonas phosphati]
MNQILATAFNGLFLHLGLALLFAVLAGVLRSPRFKGWLGERAVQNTIRAKLDPLVYVDLHNVTLPTRDGSTQIDHVLFSPYGVFVLETKNFKGWIFGSERQAQWTQQIFKRRTRFQNPLRQNYKHMRTLQELLDLPAEHVHSVIAFVGDCEFKTEMPAHVTRGSGFVAYIQSFQQTVWDPAQMQAAIDRLERLRLAPGRTTQARHVAHVQEIKARKAGGKGRGVPHQTVVEPALEVPESQVRKPAPLIQQTAEPVLSSIELASTCPQCGSALQRRLMQRGPLAGQAFFKCSSAQGCSFVRLLEPLPQGA